MHNSLPFDAHSDHSDYQPEWSHVEVSLGRPVTDQGRNGYQEITHDYISQLYDEYGSDLQAVRKYITARIPRPNDVGMRVKFDDLESEITYLLVRDHKPTTVVEVGPCDGWSTIWILAGLRDNGSGVALSYDKRGRAPQFVPVDLHGQWRFTLGDVRQDTRRLPAQMDFALLDAAHSRSFAMWYLRELIPRLQVGSPVIIHDVYRPLGKILSGESRLLQCLLRTDGAPRHYSLSRTTAEGRSYQHDHLERRVGLGIPPDAAADQLNPAVFLRHELHTCLTALACQVVGRRFRNSS